VTENAVSTLARSFPSQLKVNNWKQH